MAGKRSGCSAARARGKLFEALIAVAALLLAPPVADACPVCFGAAESPLLDSARLGVLAMVGVTLVILAAFGSWFLRLRRLAGDHDDEGPVPVEGSR